jgi:predicted CoA-binding protein
VLLTNDPETLRRLLLGVKTIAVVGCSPKRDRDSHVIAEFLVSKGYDVVPVNPAATEILGRKCYPDVASIPKQVQLVNVFRAPEHVPAVVEDALLAKADALWLQSGIRHDAAAKKASDAGLYVVQDACIAVAHRTLVRT